MAGLSIYEGHVGHTRHQPKHHALRYAVFSFLIDLDQVDDIAAGSRLFSHNRFNLFSFHDRDHGDGSDRPLREQIAGRLAGEGLSRASHRIRLLCYPRLLGYVFNPLSVYYCYDEGETLSTIVYEVHNTFGERHFYVLPVAENEHSHVEQSCAKAFHVSPFLAVQGRYRFRLSPPAERLALGIDLREGDETVLTASFTGRARPFSDKALAGLAFRYPLMTLKVIAGIHWEALRLLLKGLPVFRHPDTIAPAAPRPAYRSVPRND